MQSCADELAELLGPQADAAEIERARTLFAIAIETPGGLKVQTIHRSASACCSASRWKPTCRRDSPSSTSRAPTRCSARRSTPCWREATAQRARRSRTGAYGRDPYAAEERFDELLRGALRLRPRIEERGAPRHAAMRPMGCAHWKSRCGKR